jgi:hypothetical protein
LRSTAVAETRDLNDDETIKFRSLQTESKDCQVKSMMQWHEENLRSIGGGESTSFTPENRTKSSLKAFFFE